MPLPVGDPKQLIDPKEYGFRNPVLRQDENGNPYYEEGDINPQPIPTQPGTPQTDVASKDDIDLLNSFRTSPPSATTPATPNAPNKTAPSASQSDIDLLNSFKTNNTEPIDKTPIPNDTRGTGQKLFEGIMKGVQDVGFSGVQGLLWVGKNIPLPGAPNAEEQYNNFNEYVKQKNDEYAKANPDDQDSWFTASNVGRVAGSILATAPFMPARALLAAKSAIGALPTVLSTGERVAANLFPRLVGSSIEGATGGSIFGAATNSTNDKGLASNIASNALAGAVGGPVLNLAGTAAKAILPTGIGAAYNAVANKFVNAKGVVSKSARKVLGYLENDGLTLDEAQDAVQRMGPEATLADVSPTMQYAAGALAQRGTGRSGNIVKNRFEARAKNGNQNAHNLVEQRLGPRPDLKWENGKLKGPERDAIYSEGGKVYKPAYEKAYASGHNIDTQSIVDGIDKAARKSVGEKEATLKTIKKFFYGTDDAGNPYLKSDPESLHEIRMGLDTIYDSKNPNQSLGIFTKNAVEKIRNAIDKEIKKIPGMPEADREFAKVSTIAKGLDYGYTAFDKETIPNFNKIWNAATPELKETIRKGLRTKISEIMEKANSGELAGAQRKFGKQSLSRHILKTAFGSDGEAALDDLATQANLRSTEQLVASRNITGNNLRVNADLDQESQPGIGGFLSDLVHGAAMDITTGSPVIATTLMGAKAAVRGTAGHVKGKMTQGRKDAFAEGIADIISRNANQGSDEVFNSLRAIQNAQDVSKQISSIQGRIGLGITSALPKTSRFVGRLPVAGSSVVGNPVVSVGQEAGNTVSRMYSKLKE